MTELRGRADKLVLTINTGSSSLKLALYRGSAPTRLLAGEVQRIGAPGSRARLVDGEGATVMDDTRDVPNHGAALTWVLTWLRAQRSTLQPDAVGHRVVHGGRLYRTPQRVTGALVAALRELVVMAPEHLPQALESMETITRAYPSVPQVACFDTAFHRSMPAVAQTYPLTQALHDAGVVRYGFHGLSYEYIVQALRRIAPREAAGRLIIAHLGNGASLAAVHGGTSVDTTMGFTPAGGLMMGTRPGDLDPGVLLYLMTTQKLAPAALNDVINRQAGLLGMSGTSADMRDLLAMQATDPRAARAVALFCYQATKHLGALIAVLGGVDTLVFTGGIGEHAAPVRARITANLAFLGIRLDSRRNAAHASIISEEAAPVTVRVMPTDEDLMIFRHTHALLGVAEHA